MVQTASADAEIRALSHSCNIDGPFTPLCSDQAPVLGRRDRAMAAGANYADAYAEFDRLQADLVMATRDLIDRARALDADPIRFDGALAFRKRVTAEEVEAMIGAYEAAYEVMTCAWDALPPEQQDRACRPLEAKLMSAAPTR
jgi:hypothetical protein